MKQETTITQSTIDQLTEYVYNKYSSWKNKPLIITELNNCYKILKHKDGSPLFLGKSVINK